MSDGKTLQAIFDALVDGAVILPKRIGPVRTAIKQYSLMLGYSDPTECPISAYLKPDAARNQVIEEKAPRTLGTDAVRNLKNNVSFVLRKAIELGVVSPLAEELDSWRESNPKKLMPKRNESIYSDKYAIDPLPHRLEEEIAAYENWSTKIINRDRPRQLRKRPITFFHHRQTLVREAGYLVKCKGLKRESITLLKLVDSKNAIDYVEWCIERQGKHTKGSVAVLSNIIALARYLEISLERCKQKSIIQQWLSELRRFSATLGAPVKVQHKDKRWLSLAQLEVVGRSIYPLNARRVNELSKHHRWYLARGHSLDKRRRVFRIYAFRVLQSLLIRLVIRLPLRQRNLREMRWAPAAPEDGQNLYRKDGVWRLRFRGSELKVAEVRGEENYLSYEFPSDLVGLLEEWFDNWRPVLIAAQKCEDKGKERLTNGQELVFMNSWGRPLTQDQVTHAFEMATFKFSGVSVNP